MIQQYEQLKLNFKRKDLYRMKGIIVKYKDIVCKAGIPHCGHFSPLTLLGIVAHIGVCWRFENA